MVLHPFSLILIFSYLLYSGYLFIRFKENLLPLFFYICSVLIISSFIYFYSFESIAAADRSEYFWMTNPNLKFYTNFYFSSFFGSRIMGIVFLFSFIYLIFYYFKKIKGLNYLKLFLIIIFLSYVLPLSFGYIFKPIMVNRYIIFVLIPLISFISISTFELDKQKKLFFIIILSLLTFLNHFTEQSFKQFFYQRIVSKPEYTKAIGYIDKSEFKNYTLKVRKMKSKEGTTNAVAHYINYLGDKNDYNINLVSLENNEFTEFFGIYVFKILMEKIVKSTI